MFIIYIYIFLFSFLLEKCVLSSAMAKKSTFLSLSVLTQQTTNGCFVLIFPENRIWHFMQIVGDNLHEISNPVFSEKNTEKHIWKCLLLKNLPRVLSVNVCAFAFQKAEREQKTKELTSDTGGWCIHDAKELGSGGFHATDHKLAGVLAHFFKGTEYSVYIKSLRNKTGHYENTPIQIYWKFHHQKLSFRIEILIFFIFLLKT